MATRSASALFITSGRSTSMLTKLANMAALIRQRRQLAELDATQLRDLGLTRRDALTEARRLPWDAPRSWTC